MSLSEASKLKKAILITAGGAAVLLFGILIINGLTPREPRPVTKRLKLPEYTPPDLNKTDLPYGTYEAPIVAPPSERAPKHVVARAMDKGSIRGLVTRLRLAAATGNDRVKSPTMQSLRKYGSLATPILEEAISSEENEAVREVLIEALAQVQ